VLGAEPELSRPLFGRRHAHRGFEVLEATAVAADEVMVVVDARVVDGSAARGADASHEAELVQ
jgi:ethanolamine ammonia-lyase small subunit